MRMMAAMMVAIAASASSARGEDWAQSIVDIQRSLATSGISLNGGVTGFGQGLALGDGQSGIPFGGKADVLVGVDMSQFGLWSGLSISTHFEQTFGQSDNLSGAGSILPVNTALAFPTLGGTTADLSLIVTQKFGDAGSIALGKFNMLDAAARVPLMGGGGETTFWNIGLAAPVSGVTPPYIVGTIVTMATAPAKLTLMVYDPRNAQDVDVIAHPFAQGVTTSLSATAPFTLFGLTGYHTLRGVYSTAEGFNFDKAPQLILPPGGEGSLNKQGYFYGSYAIQQFLWVDPDNPGKGWGLFGQISASDANPNPIGNTIIAGLGGSMPGLPDDRWGVAWSGYLWSRALRGGLVSLGGGLSDERVVEAYYDHAIDVHVRLGPDVQVIWPGTPGSSVATFLGVRGRVGF